MAFIAEPISGTNVARSGIRTEPTMRDQQPGDSDPTPGDRVGARSASYLSLGIGLGLALGIVFGLLVFDSIGLGIGVGLALGAGLGVAAGQYSANRSPKSKAGVDRSRSKPRRTRGRDGHWTYE